MFRRVKLHKHRPLQQSGSQLVRNLPPRRRRLLPSLRHRNRVPVKIKTRAMEMGRRRASKKRSRNRRSPKVRQRRKRQRNRGPRRAGPELHSSNQLVSPNQGTSPQSHCRRVGRPLLSLWVLGCELCGRESNFFTCSDILCARARAMHSSSTTFLLSLCATHLSLWCIFLRCFVDVCARPCAKKGAKKCFLWCRMHHGFQELVFERIAS